MSPSRERPHWLTREIHSRENAVDGIVLRLQDGRKEALDPSTLHIRSDDILICRVRSGRFPARFGRSAQLAVLNLVEKRGAYYVLAVGGLFVTLAED